MKVAKAPKAQKPRAHTHKTAKRSLKTAVNGRRQTKAPVKAATVGAHRQMSAVPNNGWVDGPQGAKRPISPSIQIWKFSPSAYMHVGVRIAGCVLTGGFTLAGLTSAFVTSDIPAVLDSLKVAAPVVVPVLKAAVVAPLVYHGLGGARQIYQDFTAKGYDQEFQDKSSYAIAGATAAATVYFGAI